MINYIKKDLFSAPAGSIVAHATNCKGVWGNGIAKSFATKFPKAFKDYQFTCKNQGTSLAGTAQIIKTHKYDIVCLYTSKKYGIWKDSKEEILEQTLASLVDLIKKTGKEKGKNFSVHMPKINSGLFAVPWKDTEAIIRRVDKIAIEAGFNITWNIYAP